MKSLTIYLTILFPLLMFAGTVFDIPGSQPSNYRLLGERKASYRVVGNKIIMTIPVDPDDRWPGVALLPQNGKHFDFSGYSVLAADIRNPGNRPALLQLEIVNVISGNQFSHVVPGGIALEPGESAVLKLRFFRAGNFGAAWAPGGQLDAYDGFDGREHHLVVDKVDQLRFFVKDGEWDQTFEISKIRLEEPVADLPAALENKERFYPCIDRFGQYIHADWPGKLHDASLWKNQIQEQDADLAAHTGHHGVNRFGGWAAGPQFNPTGHFYPVKHKGKWYFADPEGKLFWSLGMDGVLIWPWVAYGAREHYFAEIPEDDPAYAHCFGTAYPRLRWYRKMGISETPQFNFIAANLLRKYGGTAESVEELFLERSARRLKSWGFNTIGNWSDLRLTGRAELPYAVMINSAGPTIAGDEGWWRDFSDVFDPGFTASLQHTLLTECAAMLDDPFCIGFFVGNEISWGEEIHLARGVLKSPPAQQAKQVFADRLRQRYGTVEKLNAAWRSGYQSWDDFLQSTELPNEKFADEDLTRFNLEIIESYFAKVSETLRETAPGKLYLGCRFPNEYRKDIVRIAARYVDVLSFNLYKYSVASFELPEGVDKPVIIGEWHFGTMNHGPPSPGLCAVTDQSERARAFDRYVKSALWNPNIVGAHYFALYDQPACGKAYDDENMQFGFLSVVDAPYPDMIDASRRISENLYRIRAGQIQAGIAKIPNTGE